jgi:hypothetical protein
MKKFIVTFLIFSTFAFGKSNCYDIARRDYINWLNGQFEYKFYKFYLENTNLANYLGKMKGNSYYKPVVDAFENFPDDAYVFAGRFSFGQHFILRAMVYDKSSCRHLGSEIEELL